MPDHIDLAGVDEPVEKKARAAAGEQDSAFSPLSGRVFPLVVCAVFNQADDQSDDVGNDVSHQNDIERRQDIAMLIGDFAVEGNQTHRREQNAKELNGKQADFNLYYCIIESEVYIDRVEMVCTDTNGEQHIIT